MELCDLYILDQDYAKAAFCCEEVFQFLVAASLESDCSGVAAQPTQPSLPPEASRDPIHLGRLRAAGAGEEKLIAVDEDTIC